MTQFFTYKYDALNRRTQKTVKVDNVQTSDEYCTYVGEQLAQVVSSQAATRERYFNGPGLDNVLAVDVTNLGEGGSAGVAGTYWYDHDHQGSIIDVWRSGTLSFDRERKVLRYDRFGGQTVSWTSNFSGDVEMTHLPRHGYTGQVHDPETGLMYYGQRYYDPSTGRFVSQDPIRDGDNWYAYVGNNPANMVDPSGLAGFWAGVSSGEARTHAGDSWLSPIGLPSVALAGDSNVAVQDALEMQADNDALAGAMKLSWLNDEYADDGWSFVSTPFGFTGSQGSSMRQMTFDAELNQTGYYSSSRQWQLQTRDDGSVVRAHREYGTGRSWDETLVESTKVRQMRQNTYWATALDAANENSLRLANTLALAEGVGNVLDSTVRIASGPAGTLMIDLPEAVTGQSMTRPGQQVGWDDRVLAGIPVGVVSARQGKRLLTFAENVARGHSFERSVIQNYDEFGTVSKNRRATGLIKIPYRGKSTLWSSIPDVLVSNKAVIEIKNQREIYRSRQLLTQVAYARQHKLAYRLIISPNSSVNKEAQELISSVGGQIQVYNRRTREFTPYIPK